MANPEAKLELLCTQELGSKLRLPMPRSCINIHDLNPTII
jgi:hypothetical protein